MINPKKKRPPEIVTDVVIPIVIIAGSFALGKFLPPEAVTAIKKLFAIIIGWE